MGVELFSRSLTYARSLVGSGVTDDTNALEDAIGAVCEAMVYADRFGRGGRVFLPRGRFKTTRPLDIYADGVEIEGISRFGSAIINAHGGPTFRFRSSTYLTTRQYGGGAIRRLAMTYAGSDPSSGAHVEAVNWDHIELDSLYLSNHYRGVESKATTNLSFKSVHIEAGGNVSSLHAGSAAVALLRQEVNAAFPGAQQDPVDGKWYANNNGTIIEGCNWRSGGGPNGFDNTLDIGSADGVYIDGSTHIGSAVNSCLHVKPEQSNLGPFSILVNGAFLDPSGQSVAKRGVWFENPSGFTPATSGHAFNGIRCSLANDEAMLFDCAGVDDVSINNPVISYSGKESVKITRGGTFNISGGIWNDCAQDGGGERHITLASAATVSRVNIKGGSFKSDEVVTLAGTVSNFSIDVPTAVSLASAATLPVRPEHTTVSVSGTTTINDIAGTFNGHKIVIEATASFTVAHAAGNIRLNGGANFAMATNYSLELVYNAQSALWKEIGRRG